MSYPKYVDLLHEKILKTFYDKVTLKRSAKSHYTVTNKVGKLYSQIHPARMLARKHNPCGQ